MVRLRASLLDTMLQDPSATSRASSRAFSYCALSTNIVRVSDTAGSFQDVLKMLKFKISVYCYVHF